MLYDDCAQINDNISFRNLRHNHLGPGAPQKEKIRGPCARAECAYWLAAAASRMLLLLSTETLQVHTITFEFSLNGLFLWRSLQVRPAVRSVTLNLANKFSQCTFSVTEHYDLFSDLIILRQA